MKNFRFYIIAWIALVAVLNIVAFVSPAEVNGVSKYSGMFWPAYICVMISCVGQLGCTYYALKNAGSGEKLFLNFPLIIISYFGLIISIIFGVVSLAVPGVPTWIGIIIAAVMLLLVIVAVAKAAAAAEIIEAVGDRNKEKTQFMKSLTVELRSLLDTAETEDKKKIANEVYEAARFGDFASHEELAELDSQIKTKCGQFSEAMKNDNGDVQQIGRELVDLLKDRDNKCRVLK